MSESNETSGRDVHKVEVAPLSVNLAGQPTPDITPGARRVTRHLAWSLIILFAFFTGLAASALIFSVNQASLNHCQRVVNTRFQKADIERAIATQESGQAQIDLWEALLALRGTQAQRRAEFIRALRVYEDRVHKVTAIRYPARTGTQICAG